MLIINRKELTQYLDSLEEEDFREKLTRPDTKWKIVDITNITFYISKLKDMPLGLPIELPHFIKLYRGLVNFTADDHLCFFRCLAVFQGADSKRCEKAAKKLFLEYSNRFYVSEFAGVQLFDLPKLEDFYKINFVVYELDNAVAKLVQRSRELCSQTMKLNLFKNHLSLVKDFDIYCHGFQCAKCDRLFNRKDNYNQHLKTCTNEVRETFPGDIYKIPPTIYEKLDDIDIFISPQDRHFPFFSCFDFECYISQENLPKNGPKLTYQAKHVLIVASFLNF